jgi:exodeoxyribonuclease V alpha subunit
MLDKFYDAETSIITSIKAINSIKNSVKETKLDNNLFAYQKEYSINFGEEQIEAIKGALKNNFYIITGGPGTGKTTIIKAVVNLLKSYENIKDTDIALLAPTGRSAKRMSESVGMYASTIHKYLKWNKETETFQVNDYNKSHEKVIIVDEASMIDIFLFDSLLKGIHLSSKLILIGDENQLPSIGPGDILYDLLRMDGIKSKCLNKIYRVKKDSYINTLASDIKDKKVFESIEDFSDFKFIQSSDEDIYSYIKEISNKIKDKKINIDNYQVLAPMYKGYNGIDNLNNLMAEIFNNKNDPYQIGDKYYRVNDKVIQLVNDIDNNIFNGDIGYIKDISYVDKKLTVTIDFMGNKVIYNQGEFDRFSLAYAISIHKAQGSEYDNVVIVLAKSFKRMFYNKLIYTAVTRAKKSLIIIGSLDSFNDSIQTTYSQKRITYMKLAK